MVEPAAVHSQYKYCHSSVPPLGLCGDDDAMNFSYRAYVLELARGNIYVGIAHKSDVKQAVNRHFAAENVTH